VTRVAIFTDNDFNKVNGVTTTLKAVLRHSPPEVVARVYTAADLETECPDYFAARSIGVGLPWYREMEVYWPRWRRFARALRADGINVVHITTPGPIGLAGRLLARRLGIATIGSYHTHLGAYVATFSGSARLGRWTEQYMRWLYGACDPVLVPSERTRSFLESEGYPRGRLRIWARGVDVAAFSPARRSARLRNAWHVDDRRPVIMYVGRLSREKGLDLIPDVQRYLYTNRIAHQLVFVGDGPMAPELRQRCPDAVFLGKVPHHEVAVAMASADVFLFPSETDTLGNVVLEAQASGLPVVVSNQGGPQENMLDGVTGTVVRAGRAEAYGESVGQLLRNADERRRMSRRSREFAETRNWPDSLVPLVQAWDGAAARCGAPLSGGRTREPRGLPLERPA
jgi:glycosyltransferase involved in cell wall biosynthesis